ncbi:glycosyltransferase [Haliea sp. E1-2-M8]|uniref:glycosyltransferase n=1 Tax=Haliea sp. E1-2-M8 TaxID=3064706 RepID=UPI002722E59D|nr:glycosyltransferase [Haliea sp. E1-2-M8]MDO8861102.1 glycosyltransferase [Haliea sp. E1-2-M8]
MRILLACLLKPEHCPRARRFADLLSGSHSVTLLSGGVYDSDSVKNLAISKWRTGPVEKLYAFVLLLTGSFERYLQRKNFCSSVADDYDLVFCHDALLLPDLIMRCSSARMILDAREYYPRQFENKIVWRLSFARLYHWIFANFLQKIHKGITVSAGVANLYEQQYKVRFDVVPGYPAFHDIHPTPVNRRGIRLVHHGVSNANRSLDVMIEAVQLLPQEYSLDMYLVPADQRSFEGLCRKAGRAQRVRILPPVAPDEIIPTLNSSDIGLFVSPPATVNLQNALPNKFFEFIQARLAVVVTPLKEVSERVLEYNVGVVTEDFSAEAIAAAIQAMDVAALTYYKQQSHAQARELSMLALRGKLEALVRDD